MADDKGRFRIIDHTADVGLKVEAPSLEALFATAARGLYHLLGHFIRTDETVERTFTIEGPDLETLLHDWLGELLWYFESEGIVFDDFTFIRLDDSILEVKCTGAKIDPQASERFMEIKAITYHGLQINRTNDHYETTIILDT